MRNHLVIHEVADFPAEARAEAATLAGRSMLVQKQTRCRSSASRGAICRVPRGRTTSRPAPSAASGLPAGLRESARLPEPIFTPSTKAQSGHDLNITEAQAADLVGADVLARARALTLALYAEGSAYAESCGIIVADTKFEFGLMPAHEHRHRTARPIV